MNDRQKQIIDAARQVFLSDGIGVSTAKIAKAAGVSNGTLFNAFATKQDLIDALYLSTKIDLFNAMPLAEEARLDRATFYQSWRNYLEWARQDPIKCKVMHLMFESGLVSDEAHAKGEAVLAPHAKLIEEALDNGTIRGPSVDFVTKLIFFQIDLVIDQDLDGDDEALAFEMLCQSIGLSQ